MLGWRRWRAQRAAIREESVFISMLKLGEAQAVTIALDASLPVVTVIAIIARFEKQGAVVSRWSDDDPPRRLYQLNEG